MVRAFLQLGFIGCFCLAGAATACGGDDDDGGGSSGGASSTGGATSTGGGSQGGRVGTGGSGGGACINIAGAWTVRTHCVPTLVGSTVQVTQTGCMFTEMTTGISGTLDQNGNFTASGMVPGLGTANCTGTATATMITENCTIAGQACAVTLGR
jgi:hypothetical protein